MGPLAEHDVVVQIVTEVLPKLQRMFVKLPVPRKHIVGSDDRGVPATIASAEPAFFDDGNILDVVILGEIISGGESVQSGTNNDDVILCFGLWVTPGAIPAFLTREAVDEDFPGGIGFHDLIIVMRNKLQAIASRPQNPVYAGPRPL